MERLTIDEVIKDFRYDAEQNMADLDVSFAKRNNQIAEWLEELKAYRTLDKTNFSDGYNRAIDDFLKKALTFEDITGCVDSYKLENIAEQLKAGGENDNLRR